MPYARIEIVLNERDNSMIRIAICDDEPEMVAALHKKTEQYMRAHSHPFSITHFSGGNALLTCGLFFDLIFLDIQMGSVNGIQAAQALRASGVQSALVFVTVLQENVYDAFEVDAADYLLKPVDDVHFTRTMDRVCTRICKENEKRLLVQASGWSKSVRFDDILYCEVINRKIYIHTKQETIDYYCKIETLEKQLDECFFKCHRSYLVHLKYVCGYAGGTATLEGGAHIPVSRLRAQDFTRAILNHMKTKGY